MKRNLPKVKRRSKQSFKSLDMKDDSSKKIKNNNFKQRTLKSKPQKDIRKKEEIQKNEKTAVSNNKIFSEFKQKGLLLIKGRSKDKGFVFTKYIIPIISVLFIICVIGIYYNAPTGFVEWAKTKIALNTSGSGFPVKYDVSTGKDIAFSNGQLLVATETDLKCYNKNGNAVFSRIHGFANPILKTSKIRTLIYGIGTSQYKIETANEEIISDKTASKQQIICGDISDSGVYALATKSNEDVGLVTVYDKNGTEIYKYHSALNYITGITVSENGKKICVTSLSTSKAKFVSKISILSIDSVNPLIEKEFKDELVYTTEYSDNKNICIITDKRYMNFSEKGIQKSVDFNSDFLNKFEISDKYILLYTTADLNSLNGKIMVLTLTGSIKSSFSVESNVSDISVANKNIYILSDKVLKINFEGEKEATIKVKNGATKIKAFKSNAVVLYSSGIEKID